FVAATAAVSPARLCTTILGTPVVPDVSSTHSVRTLVGVGSTRGAICGVQGTQSGKCENCGAGPSTITASISAPAIKARRCSGLTSGGKIVSRRATPSSSISASAPVSWLAVATRTERPLSSASRPPSAVPATRSARRTRAARSNKNASAGAFARCARSGSASVRAVLIRLDEIADGDGELHVLGRRERIDAEPVFQARHQHRDTERVEAGIEQRHVVAERGQRLAVLARDPSHLVHYG